MREIIDMSHGELGQLRGSDESLVSIITVIKQFEQNLPSHVPLVITADLKPQA